MSDSNLYNPPLPWTQPGILVGVDGSENSFAALDFASTFGPALGLPVHATVVWDVPVLLQGDYYMPDDWADSQEDAEDVARTAERRVFGRDVPSWFTRSTRRGSPAQALVELSHEAEMIVVGSRGHGGFMGLMLGSVSAALAAHAHCSAMIVHGRRAPEEPDFGP